MKNIIALFLTTCSFALFAQSLQKEDIIFCNAADNPNLEIKLTKTHDKLYTLYANKISNSVAKWQKLMDLDEPVVWAKNSLGEVADFYSLDSYSYWLRLFFDNNYEALGHGEFLLPNVHDQEEGEPDKYIVKDCIGTLK